MILHKNRLLFVFVGLSVLWVNIVQTETWHAELQVRANNYSSTLYLGTDLLGTDGFDMGLDITRPPPGFTFYAYLLIDTPPYFLSKDVRSAASDSIIWVLKLVNATGLIDTISWDPDSLPGYGDFILADTIDMRLYDEVIYKGNQTLLIRYTSINQGCYEYQGDSQSNTLLIDQGCQNPPYSGTAMRYKLMMDSFVALKIYDIRGTLVTTLVSRVQDAGLHTVYWYGKDNMNQNVNSGVYFCRFNVKSIRGHETCTQTKKLIYLR